jgi:hypothetical protein
MPAAGGPSNNDELARLKERLQRAVQTSASNRAEIERLMKDVKARDLVAASAARKKKRAAKRRKRAAKKTPAKKPKRRRSR